MRAGRAEVCCVQDGIWPFARTRARDPLCRCRTTAKLEIHADGDRTPSEQVNSTSGCLKTHHRICGTRRARLRQDAAVRDCLRKDDGGPRRSAALGRVVLHEDVVHVVARRRRDVTRPAHDVHESEHTGAGARNHAERPEIHDPATVRVAYPAGGIGIPAFAGPAVCRTRIESVQLAEARERLEASVVRAINAHQLRGLVGRRCDARRRLALAGVQEGVRPGNIRLRDLHFRILPSATFRADTLLPAFPTLPAACSCSTPGTRTSCSTTRPLPFS